MLLLNKKPMKLKQLVDYSLLFIERYGIKICTSLFLISSIVFGLCWLDSKTSIQSTLYEIRYTCNNVYGLGNNTALLLSNLKHSDYNNFVEVKNDYPWLNLKLVNKHFTIRSNIMRQETYQYVLVSLFITNAISFCGMLGFYLYKKYKHEYILKGLTKMIKDNHNNKT